MSRQTSQTHQNRSAMGIELSRQDSLPSESNSPNIDPRFAGLRITRDNKRTSERREIAEMRHQAGFSRTGSDIPDIPENNSLGAFTDSTDDSQRLEHSASQDDSQLPSLQFLSPEPTSDNSRRQPRGFINIFGNNNNHFSRPEQPQQSNIDPVALLSTILSGLSYLPTSNLNNNGFQPQQTMVEEPIPANQTTTPQNNTGRPPLGAVVVRTVQPGPNGSAVVRMRVISLDDLLGQSHNNNGGEHNTTNQEGNQASVGLYAALFNMLAGLQGPQSGNFGGLFTGINLEKGLEKEVLDSLPVVRYNHEQFKNVEEESKTCAICLDHFEDGDDVRFLWCIHRFHKHCVDQWLDTHTACPTCKKDYSDSDKSFQ